MSTIALTPTSYLVLGCVADAGPMTPYDLKQVVAGGIGYFWAFPHSQLYSEPVRLAEAGLLVETREAAGRRRRTFSITDAGRVALRAWLTDATAELPDIRDIGLLKLYFGGHADPEQISALARSQYDAHQQRCELYEALGAAQMPGPAGATLGLGLAWERAAATFWKGISEHPPTP